MVLRALVPFGGNSYGARVVAQLQSRGMAGNRLRLVVFGGLWFHSFSPWPRYGGNAVYFVDQKMPAPVVSSPVVRGLFLSGPVINGHLGVLAF